MKTKNVFYVMILFLIFFFVCTNTKAQFLDPVNGWFPPPMDSLSGMKRWFPWDPLGGMNRFVPMDTILW
jgi:hypothetical protein